ncbi:MAG: carboxypeptidase regulatory-like domain-containing protein, partial [Deltaproteobacteria bacterium]|nr:carboxypeptidase regulatory-like domain-containing protein [Nannocystaceae bacterium]
MTSRRRIAAVSLTAAVVIALLLLWWRRVDDRDAASTDEIARDDPSAKRKLARPVGAEEEASPRSQLPWNRPGTSISGRVTDESGKPVAQADVCAVLESPRLPSALQREPKCSKSGADGRYVLAELPPVRVAIAAGAPTFIPGNYDPPGDRDYVDLHDGQAVKDIDVVLRGGGVQVHGVVKDIAGGVIEGALVMGRRGWRGGAEGLSLTRSDAQGAFSMWVEPGELNIEATADGYAGGSKSGVAPGYTFEVLLTPESVLAGRVVRKSDGKPVAEAYVTLGDWFWSEQGTYTDEAGNFRLDRLEPGRYKPVASHPESYGQLAESVRLGLGETVEGVVIEVHPLPALRGKIVLSGEEQKPCEDGSASVTGTVSQHHGYAPVTHAGEIEILALPPDTYDVEVRCRGYVSEAAYPQVIVSDAPIELQVWEVKAGLTVKGVVVDVDGKPVGRASVGARPVGTAARAQQTFAWGEETDEAGAFEITGILAGSYELHASHEDLVAPETPTKITIAEGERPAEQRLVLERGGTIRGRVVDADGRAVPAAQVQVVG